MDGSLITILRNHPKDRFGRSARSEGWEGREEARSKGLEKARIVASEKITQAAEEAYADIVPMMKELRETGMTLKGIVERLNDEGHATRRGKPWSSVQVMRVLERPAK